MTSSAFSRFIREASSREKKRVYREVIEAAIKEELWTLTTKSSKSTSGALRLS